MLSFPDWSATNVVDAAGAGSTPHEVFKSCIRAKRIGNVDFEAL